MEGQQVLEHLDSLWFFATVFSSRTPPPALEKPAQNDFVEPPGEEIATPIFQNQQNNNVGEEKRRIENGGGGLVLVGSGCEMETEEKEEKRRKSRRRRKIVGEMDLSYAVKEIISECWLFEQRIGDGNHYQRKKKMPPFEDSMAMKEHIRSWAYAVACTVR